MPHALASRPLLVLLVALAPAVAHAVDLGVAPPPKPRWTSRAHDPIAAVIAEGGDTIEDALVIGALPFDDSGSTVGFTDDYDAVCPVTGSTSPDVVYVYTPPSDVLVDIDLLGSSYDTKLYVLDAALNPVACNDDAHPDFTSRLARVDLRAGQPSYLVIDGYAGEAGNYVLAVTESPPCVVHAPQDAQAEDEPPLVDGYVDVHNGGCNSPEVGAPLLTVTRPSVVGAAGWYTSPNGLPARDTDWFEFVIPATGFLEIEGDAEFLTIVLELAPPDCGSVEPLQMVSIGPCSPGMLTIPGEPGSTAWVWVGSPVYDGPVDEYAYVLRTNAPLAAEPRSWSAVKGLFDERGPAMGNRRPGPSGEAASNR